MEQNNKIDKAQLKQKQKSKNIAPNTFIYLTVSTWIKDSHGLYDYQKQQQSEKSQKNIINNDSQKPIIPKAISDYILLSNPQKQIKKQKYVKKQYQLSLNTQKMHILINNKNNESVADFRSFDKISKDQKYKKCEIVANIDARPNFATRKIQFTFRPTQQQNQIMRKNCEKPPKKMHKMQPGIVVNQQRTLYNEKGYQLKVGATICFGKVRYYVREIMINGKLETCQKNVEYSVSKFQQQKQTLLQSADLQTQFINQYDIPMQKQQQNQILNQQQVQQSQIPKLQKLKTHEQPPLTSHNSPKNPPKKILQQQQQISCRICYDTIHTPQNPLINLCKCTGSCKYTHIQCLKHWINNKVIVQNRLYCISIEKINCQICKMQIPMNILLNGGCEQIVLIQRPRDGNYIMFEKLNVSKKNILIFKNVPSEGISIGRDSSCYVKIQDITVSRFHATLNYDKQCDKFFIYDKGSKFGTLVFEQPLRIQVGKKQRSVQIGRTLLSIVVKRREKILVDDII